MSAVCECGPMFREPKGNGTCSTCGGWLPDERPGGRCFVWAYCPAPVVCSDTCRPTEAKATAERVPTQGGAS